jgi:hypothetical protein
MQDKPRTALYPRNDHGQPHGYWNVIYGGGFRRCEQNYVNGENFGLWSWYNSKNEIDERKYYAR